MRYWVLSAFVLVLAAVSLGATAQVAGPLQAAVADPVADAEHPAQLQLVRYPSSGSEVPARFFVTAGQGPHPTVLLLHGLPGAELNLDLARAMQRAGWNVLAIHYRGVWGAPGQFLLSHTIEDARAALAWLRDPAQAALVDAGKIVVLGHSMGGFDTVMMGEDTEVVGYVTISAWDVMNDAATVTTPEAHRATEAALAETLSFTNMTYAALSADIAAHGQAWNWEANAAKMAGRPVLVIDSNDGAAPRGDAIVAAVISAGGPAPTRLKFETDHAYNDHRLALASAVVNWLQNQFP